ncbi:MAG: MFS transporter [Gammaproteobacteria bacterium TMED92]|nr:MAG: MFS transporter [Gammaproteobacteria bacterium TMED92]
MKLFIGNDGAPLFTSKRVFINFLVLVLCAQFAFSVLAMKGALLPQMLELWQISKTQFGVLMSIYGIVHNVFYLALAWAQDRFSPRILIPVNMVLGGVTTFFLGQTDDFVTLCVLFVMLSLWCEGAFWPAVLSSVRKSTSDSNQGKIFGLLEGGRGAIELLQNALTIGLYAYLGYSLLGLEIAFMVNAVIMVALGVITWFILPNETLLKSGNNTEAANREVLAGMSVTLRLPEVWLAGVAGFGVYLAYTSMPYFLTYLQDLHALPVLAISIFGIVSTSGGRIGVALPSGFIADRFLGGASGGLKVGLFGVAGLAAITVLLTLNNGSAWLAMLLMMLLSVLFFFMRALYFAPFGEMGLPPRFSGSVIAVAAFLIYLPSSFAYLLWGFILDSLPGATGYALMFAILGVFALVGGWVAQRLHTRINNGAAARISNSIQAMDAQLGLGGEEKTLSDLVNAKGR